MSRHFLFGVMPMLFASGAGAASRLALGAAVVFGMAVNAILGTLFVPNFWELLQRFQEKYLDGLFAPKTPAQQTHEQQAPARQPADKNESGTV